MAIKNWSAMDADLLQRQHWLYDSQEVACGSPGSLPVICFLFVAKHAVGLNTLEHHPAHDPILFSTRKPKSFPALPLFGLVSCIQRCIVCTSNTGSRLSRLQITSINFAGETQKLDVPKICPGAVIRLDSSLGWLAPTYHLTSPRKVWKMICVPQHLWITIMPR